MYTSIRILLVILLSIIQSCSWIDTETNNSKETITECFDAQIQHINLSANEVIQLVYGEWLLKNSIDEESVLFNNDNRYFIFKNKQILESGTFKVIKDRGHFYIETSNQNSLTDGEFKLCSIHIYNIVNNAIWFKICDCFI